MLVQASSERSHKEESFQSKPEFHCSLQTWSRYRGGIWRGSLVGWEIFLGSTSARGSYRRWMLSQL
jgi:hypothetical protein